MRPWKSIQNQRGFTLMELMIIIAIMGVLTTLAFSSFRMSREKIACKNVYYAMQAAKMRSIATGHNAYVDFDMNGGDVADNFFTVYLDTDGANSTFGETNNSNTENEFTESNYPMPDTSGGFPGVALPTGVAFGGKATSPGGGTMGTYGPAPNNWTIQDSGVNATDKRLQFTSRGTASAAGEVYLWDTEDSLGKGCMVMVSTTGHIKRMDWDGTNWN